MFVATFDGKAASKSAANRLPTLEKELTKLCGSGRSTGSLTRSAWMGLPDEHFPPLSLTLLKAGIVCSSSVSARLPAKQVDRLI